MASSSSPWGVYEIGFFVFFSRCFPMVGDKLTHQLNSGTGFIGPHEITIPIIKGILAGPPSKLPPPTEIKLFFRVYSIGSP